MHVVLLYDIMLNYGTFVEIKSIKAKAIDSIS